MRLCIALILGSAITYLYIENQGKYFVNISRSMPYGIYKIVNDKISCSDLVLVYFDEQRKNEVEFFTGTRKPLLKKIVGFSGDKFCIKDNKVYLNNVIKGVVLDKNQRGFDLPKLKICRKLSYDEAVVMGENIDSYDSRYFGVVRKQILRRAIKIL